MANIKMRDFIKSISENIGLEDLEFINSIPDEVEAPENFNDLFHSNYLTVSAAKNNPDIAKYFKGRHLGTVDSHLKAIFKDNDLMDDYNSLEEEKDTLERLKKSFEIVKSKNQSSGGDDKWKEKEKQLKDAIQKLNDEIKQKTEAIEETENKTNQKWESKFFGLKLRDRLSTKKLTESYDFDDVSLLTTQKLNSLPYIYKLNENDTYDVYDKENPEIRVHKDGKPVSFESIIDEITQKYEKKSDGKPEEKKTVIVDEKNTSGHAMGTYVFGQ